MIYILKNRMQQNAVVGFKTCMVHSLTSTVLIDVHVWTSTIPNPAPPQIKTDIYVFKFPQTPILPPPSPSSVISSNVMIICGISTPSVLVWIHPNSLISQRLKSVLELILIFFLPHQLFFSLRINYQDPPEIILISPGALLSNFV